LELALVTLSMEFENMNNFDNKDNKDNSYGLNLSSCPLRQQNELLRKQLKRDLLELIKLDRSGVLKLTFTSGLVRYLSIHGGLRGLLDAVVSYKVVREKDFMNLNAGGYFFHNDIDVYFKIFPNEIQLGCFADIQYIRKFADYKFYSIDAVKDF